MFIENKTIHWNCASPVSYTHLPSPLYTQKLPIAKAKLKDLMDLKKFLPEKAQEFYNNLLPADVEEESDDGDVSGKF